MTDHVALAREIHASNIAAGWWPADPSQRNRGEVMMLIVSEIAEAAEGLATDAADDKLPHHPMFDVELGDTAIRLYDLIGADALSIPANFPDRVNLFCRTMHAADATRDLMLIVRAVADAMEGHRKGRMTVYSDQLWWALADVSAVAETYDVYLPPIIAEKRAFNATRADHKPENRATADGKRY